MDDLEIFTIISVALLVSFFAKGKKVESFDFFVPYLIVLFICFLLCFSCSFQSCPIECYMITLAILALLTRNWSKSNPENVQL